jgi:hypothetical protein
MPRCPLRPAHFARLVVATLAVLLTSGLALAWVTPASVIQRLGGCPSYSRISAMVPGITLLASSDLFSRFGSGRAQELVGAEQFCH